jgi:antitoxin component YwqK of YwqJK toxin-antitoxin module
MKTLLTIILIIIVKGTLIAQIETQYVYGLLGLNEKDRIIRNDSTGKTFIPSSDSNKIVFISSDYQEYKMFNKENILLVSGSFGGIELVDFFQQNGKWTEYYETGAIRSTGNYERGEPIGKWRYYYPNGQLKKLFKISLICTDSAKTYCKTGNYLEYYENGNIKVSGYYRAQIDTMIAVMYTMDANYNEIEIKARAASSKPAHKWRYYNSEGKLEKEEVY